MEWDMRAEQAWVELCICAYMITTAVRPHTVFKGPVREGLGAPWKWKIVVFQSRCIDTEMVI